MQTNFLIVNLLSVPHLECLHAFDFLLELKDAVEKSLGCGWASGNVDIDWDDSVTSTDDRVGVVVIATSVGARAHRDDPSGFWHLIVDFTQSWSHFVGQSSGDDDDISLTRRSTEHNTVTIHVVSGSGDVHHLDGTARETECEWPN